MNNYRGYFGSLLCFRDRKDLERKLKVIKSFDEKTKLLRNMFIHYATRALANAKFASQDDFSYRNYKQNIKRAFIAIELARDITTKVINYDESAKKTYEQLLYLDDAITLQYSKRLSQIENGADWDSELSELFK